MRENIIKALKEDNKLILIIGTVFISGIIVGISISAIKLPKSEPKFYIATHDINIRGGTDPFDCSVKIAYEHDTLLFGGGKGFIMRFDLRNKPKRWSKCVISLYEYQKVGSGQGLVYLFSGNWTEEEWDGYGNYMCDFEIFYRKIFWIYHFPTFFHPYWLIFSSKIML